MRESSSYPSTISAMILNTDHESWALVCTHVFGLNSFFSLRTCDTPKDILKKVYPILIPVLGFIMVVIIVNPSSLQLLSGLDPTEIESVNTNINDVIANSWLLAFSSLGGGAPNIIWEAAFLPMYIVGFLVFAWADSSDRDGLKGLATIVILAPIAIQFILGFTYGKSYGLLGRIGAMGTALEQLGGAASVVSVLVGSILDFVLVSVFFGVEHMIPEEEEL